MIKRSAKVEKRLPARGHVSWMEGGTENMDGITSPFYALTAASSGGFPL
jgi:hypothetical protein